MKDYLEYLKETDNQEVIEAAVMFEQNKIDEEELEKIVLAQDEISKRTYDKLKKVKRIL